MRGSDDDVVMIKEKDLTPGRVIMMPKPDGWLSTPLIARRQLEIEYYPSLIVSVVALHARRHAKKSADAYDWEIVILSLGKLKTLSIYPHQFSLWKRVL